MSILTVILAVSVVGCSDKKQEPSTSPAGTVERPAVSDSTALPTASDPSTEQITASDSDQSDVEASVLEAGSLPAVTQGAQESGSAPLDEETRSQVATWLQQMGSDAALERRAAADALDQQGEAAIAYVVWGLRHGSDQQKRGAATYLIGRVSPRDEDAVQTLIQSLKSHDIELQRVALQAVERFPDAQLRQALVALQLVAREPAIGPAYRARAIRAIAKLGSGGEAAMATLIELAQAGDELDVRRASYYAISKVAPAQVAEGFFQEQLQSDAPADLRRLAAKWLGTVTRRETSLLCLIAAFADPDESVRLEAGDALVAIGKPAVPMLINSLESSQVDVRRHSVLTLGKLGVFAVDAVPALQACLDDADQQVRELAAAALKMVPNQ